MRTRSFILTLVAAVSAFTLLATSAEAGDRRKRDRDNDRRWDDDRPARVYRGARINRPARVYRPARFYRPARVYRAPRYRRAPVIVFSVGIR
jgi:Ni/Co efflux regulator RcnB